MDKEELKYRVIACGIVLGILGAIALFWKLVIWFMWACYDLGIKM